MPPSLVKPQHKQRAIQATPSRNKDARRGLGVPARRLLSQTPCPLLSAIAMVCAQRGARRHRRQNLCRKKTGQHRDVRCLHALFFLGELKPWMSRTNNDDWKKCPFAVYIIQVMPVDGVTRFPRPGERLVAGSSHSPLAAEETCQLFEQWRRTALKSCTARHAVANVCRVPSRRAARAGPRLPGGTSDEAPSSVVRTWAVVRKRRGACPACEPDGQACSPRQHSVRIGLGGNR